MAYKPTKDPKELQRRRQLDNRSHQRRYSKSRKPRASIIRRARTDHLKRKFGMTVTDYDRMHEHQEGVCAICFEPETTIWCGKLRSLAIDHCHASKKVRGLLCYRCNLLLGFAHDDVLRLQSAIRYLQRTMKP